MVKARGTLILPTWQGKDTRVNVPEPLILIVQDTVDILEMYGVVEEGECE